jgi:hypothetical protein
MKIIALITAFPRFIWFDIAGLLHVGRAASGTMAANYLGEI